MIKYWIIVIKHDVIPPLQRYSWHCLALQLSWDLRSSRFPWHQWAYIRIGTSLIATEPSVHSARVYVARIIVPIADVKIPYNVALRNYQTFKVTIGRSLKLSFSSHCFGQIISTLIQLSGINYLQWSLLHLVAWVALFATSTTATNLYNTSTRRR